MPRSFTNDYRTCRANRRHAHTDKAAASAPIAAMLRN